MDGVSRRGFCKTIGALGATALLPAPAFAQPARQPAPAYAPARERPAPVLYSFFNPAEAAFVGAAVDHLIPADEIWPSASQAGVVVYIDRQLAGPFGHSSHMYMQGPWAEGKPGQGYQLRMSAGELYRAGIQATERHIGRRFGGRSFAQLAAQDQLRVLQGLERGDIELEEFYAPIFFETLLANTVEGFFADPAYGGNRDMAGWRMIGFPGAYAQYLNEVEKHGVRFERPPMSMAESVHESH